jgi:soluble lytic murein transglycosylase-like protein
MKLNAKIFIGSAIVILSYLIFFKKSKLNSMTNTVNKKVNDLVSRLESIVVSLCQEYKFNFPNYVLAMIQVESSGNQYAIGDSGKSKGLMQIQEIAMQDVNEMYGTNFVTSDLFEITPNLRIGILYLKLQTKRTGNINNGVRAFNAGESGSKKGLGKDYLEKVKEYL